MKLSFKTKLAYGVGGICDNTLYTITGTYLMLFLTTIAGLSPGVAGIIAALGSIWEAVCGPIIGFKSDDTCSRYGRRKPYLLAAAIPVMIITTLLFTTVNMSPVLNTIYYTVVILIFWTVFATFFVPYLAWGSDLTDDYDERTILRTFAFIFNQVGMCIGTVLPAVIVDILMNYGRTAQQSWQSVGILSGVCGGAALLICALSIKNDDVKDFVKLKEKKKFIELKMIKDMFKEYCDILKLKSIKYILFASVLYLIANTISKGDMVFYFKYNLGMNEGVISILMLVISFSGIVFVPFTAKLAVWADKKSIFMGGIALSGVLIIASKFWGIDSMTDAIIVCLFYSVANTCYWQLMPAMIYDVCEVEELVSREKRSGAVISLQALAESLSIALGLQMLGYMLDFAGFQEDSMVQSETALSWIENGFTVIPGIFMILVLWAMTKYPVNKKNFEKVREALRARDAGEEVDLNELNHLF